MRVDTLNHYGNPKFVFTVQTEHQEVKMCCCAADPFINDRSTNIVLVDSSRFEDLLFKVNCEKAPHLARGSKKDLFGDYKYQDANDCFNQPPDNPVPVANFYPSHEVRGWNGLVNTRGVGVDDLTRTVWLMANGAKEFPVNVRDLQAAKELCEYIGVKGSKVYSAKDLQERAKECGSGRWPYFNMYTAPK
ncbi:plasmid fertility inhibition factor family protein [Photobacterium carnosum]|uniref:plasmid fertility inhibition factor family protein n=1 Tax=Photobacterium carnosum TaxID=2023717 RepID=UPI001E5DC1E2|nr:hypothetical protein [Photobacterium carnosum]MCD9527856.1 hypothetical protein [Photobacterium carnosum]